MPIGLTDGQLDLRGRREQSGGIRTALRESSAS